MAIQISGTTVIDNSRNLTQVNSLGVGTAGSGTAGEIRATNNITAYYSDDRLKTKLGVIENALDKVDSLAGFYYEANEVAQALGYEVKKEVGVSAQSVQAVMPEVVAPAPIDEQYLTVRYERLVPLLIQAIKELRSEVKALKTAVDARTNLGLGTIATQASNNVSIIGGSITGITDLAVADGGTGASSFTSGSLIKGNGSSALSVASAADIVAAIGSTAVTNATNATNLLTANFSIVESDNNLLIKYGGTTIIQITSAGAITSAEDVTTFGTL